ncbi:glycoside hydrolase family 15 protein [Parvularcula flava]|uniref:Glucoamylase n=1 Tax=Aquisalinus luteolus TaxID=1566827 RepID=A0A8J3A4U5_9PROT|nr:glycoside hydrolase family 15 protein [Aquisalinus luteolus]NHK26632.1 glycoside hydrolase family 15 protein [Aquisalinus luteolus]GGH92934.1 glucoamylase [Aquisalinus luteolus]
MDGNTPPVLNKPSLELGMVGNGTIAGLIDEQGAYGWLCLPRLDGKPVFNALLGGSGTFAVELEGFVRSRQYYIRNTAVLCTVLEAEDGSAVEITDFAPRFEARERTFQPMGIVRRLRPISGTPRIKVLLKPSTGWDNKPLQVTRGVSHVRFASESLGFRVTTDAPISYVMSETSFLLDKPLSFLCGPDESVSEGVNTLSREWEERTVAYWQNWSRRLAIPFEWQEAVIRAAITLKMCVYEETGGIIAAATSSIPEHEGSERNWDYRFCWIRDAYFTVTALNRLSSVGTLEIYLRFLRNVVASTKGGHIQPVYGISLEQQLEEKIADALPGYRGHKPVRFGNQAAEHIQHDVYGQVILGASQAFFDTRLRNQAGIAEFRQLEQVGERAWAMHNEPDAGIWEYRTISQVHTSSALMCWAACDRLGKIAAYLGDGARADYWNERASKVRETIYDKAWNDKIKAFTGAYGGEALDASVLLMAEVGFLPKDDPRFVATVDAVDKQLRHGMHVYRYKAPDDFGTPETAFTACTFWHIDALAHIGRKEEAREIFEDLLSMRNKLGLLSEDLDPKTGQLWGNFPQTYSMVGIINSATRLSSRWAESI